MKPLAQRPEYLALTAELNEFSEAKGKVDTRIAEQESLIRAGIPDNGASHVDAALEFAKTGTVVIPNNVDAELRESHSILRKQSEALGKAMEDRRLAISELTANLSRQLSVELLPKHQSIAKRYLAALEELDALAIEEQNLMNAANSAGYYPSFREMVAWPNIGRIAEQSQSAIWYKVRELKNYTTP